MKFVCCADLHIRANRPIHRIDDYEETVLDKLTQIINTANTYKANILCAGDFFDHIRVGHKIVNKTIDILKKFKYKIFIVLGQHDVAYHNNKDIDNTPIKTLLNLDKVILLNQIPYKIKDKNKTVYIQGCSYGENIEKNKYSNSILVLHKTITKDDPPFFLKDAVSAQDMLKTFNSFKYIISGDYHVPFKVKEGKRTLVNCGPMLRQAIDQVNIKPTIWLIDTEKEATKNIPLKIKDVNDVFNLEEQTERDTSFSEDLSNLVKAIKDKKKYPNYKQVVTFVMDKDKITKLVRNKVNSILEEEENGSE